MDIQAEKINLLQTIINTTDAGLINDVKAFLSNRKTDWFDELNAEAKNDIKQGLSDADNGHIIFHDKAVKLFSKWGLK